MLHESRNKATIRFLLNNKKIISGDCLLCSVSLLLYIHNNLHLKVMFHETIRNDDFYRNTAWKHCCDDVSNG